MRVIAGKFGSRKLKGPGKLRMRPTSDRLRETLFNILGPAVEDSLFVDLYAGTGAIGIEAISRGAKEVIFVEERAASAKLIRENIAALGAPAGEVLPVKVMKGLEKLAARHLMADFIFLDPPYDDEEQQLLVLEFLDESHLLAPQGLVIVEHSSRTELPERFTRLERMRVLEQGDATLSFYCLAAAA
ncbi:MAG TPA: 16S rRNA (guanine(966)-N(2))-methyltransferase RsmD [Candidatus Baltobacteraceae bacterium]|nr:16S rRNA (guanine(966)-N(2))-methyltransferase RsmD [Candidatus Baltobacteraceae bacterium]